MKQIYTNFFKQALLEALGANGTNGAEAYAAAEKSATILAARAGSGDPSSIPSISRISATLRHNSSKFTLSRYWCCYSIFLLLVCSISTNPLMHPLGTEGTDSALASVLESLELCLKPCGSEASILEDLAKAIDLAHIQRNFVDSGRVLLNRAHGVQQQYERYTFIQFHFP
jgi:HAUS augmin-like complex subunit 5